MKKLHELNRGLNLVEFTYEDAKGEPHHFLAHINASNSYRSTYRDVSFYNFDSRSYHYYGPYTSDFPSQFFNTSKGKMTQEQFQEFYNKAIQSIKQCESFSFDSAYIDPIAEELLDNPKKYKGHYEEYKEGLAFFLRYGRGSSYLCSSYLKNVPPSTRWQCYLLCFSSHNENLNLPNFIWDDISELLDIYLEKELETNHDSAYRFLLNLNGDKDDSVFLSSSMQKFLFEKEDGLLLTFENVKRLLRQTNNYPAFLRYLSAHPSVVQKLTCIDASDSYYYASNGQRYYYQPENDPRVFYIQLCEKGHQKEALDFAFLAMCSTNYPPLYAYFRTLFTDKEMIERIKKLYQGKKELTLPVPMYEIDKDIFESAGFQVKSNYSYGISYYDISYYPSSVQSRLKENDYKKKDIRDDLKQQLGYSCRVDEPFVLYTQIEGLIAYKDKIVFTYFKNEEMQEYQSHPQFQYLYMKAFEKLGKKNDEIHLYK